MNVEQLAALPIFKIRILAGHSGLDREVSWAHATDAEDPWAWNDPGDLILTSGVVLPTGAEAQAHFVEQLAGAGLSGVAIGDDPRCPALTTSMLEAADRCGLPLLRVHHTVAFAQLVRAVAAANGADEDQPLGQVTRIQEDIRLGLVEQRSSAEVLDELGKILHCQLSVVDAERWEALLPGCPSPSSVFRAPLREELVKRGKTAPSVVRLEAEGTAALALPLPTERPAFVVALMADEPEPTLAVLQHAATACALEVNRVNASVERDRRTGSALLVETLAGRVDVHTLDRELAGRRLLAPWVIVAMRASAAEIDHLDRRWAISGTACLVSDIGPVFFACVNAAGAEVALQGHCDEDGWQVGLSDSFVRADAFVDAGRQARWAMETLRPGAAGLAHYGEVGASFLPRTVSESARVVRRVLGPLLEYDDEHNTELVQTLRTYLECGSSPKRTAETLFVHTQTVHYRMRRVADLTGRSLRTTKDVSELWLALRALALWETVRADEWVSSREDG